VGEFHKLIGFALVYLTHSWMKFNSK